MNGGLDHGEVEDLPLGPAAPQPVEIVAKREEEGNDLRRREGGDYSVQFCMKIMAREIFLALGF